MPRIARPYRKLLKLSEEEKKAIEAIAKAYNLEQSDAIRVAIMNEYWRLQKEGKIQS